MSEITAAPPAPRRVALYALLLAVGGGWGGAITATKISTSTGHHPLGLIFWQLAIATLLLGALAIARGIRPRIDAAALSFFAGVALLGTLAPNFASITATSHLPAGVVAIAVALTPMIALALAALLGLERLEPRRTFGIALGAGAVILMTAPEAALPEPGTTIFVLVAAFAALCYGAEGVFVKLRQPGGIHPMAALLGASTVGLAAVTPVVALIPGLWVPLPGPFGAAEKAMLVSGLLHVGAYWGYLRLIGDGGAVFASTVSYAVTFSAVFWGMVVLGERHSIWIWAALAVIVAGMALVQPRR